MTFDEPGAVFHQEVYDQLCRLAHRQLQGRSGQTLNTQALVHEVFLKLNAANQLEVRDEEHFLAIAARAMRQIVIDYARAKSAQRRGGPERQLSLDFDVKDIPIQDDPDQLLALDAALARLGDMDPRLEKVVELRYFGGLEVAEVARLLDISQPTVKRDCRTARAFLAQAIGG